MDAPTVCATPTLLAPPETRLDVLALTFRRIGHDATDALRLASDALRPTAPADESTIDYGSSVADVSLTSATEKHAEWGSSDDWTTVLAMMAAHRAARQRSRRWN